MKELSYEEWIKNPTPRMMWVWNDDIEEMEKKKVVYVIKDDFAVCPVLAVSEEDASFCIYGFCAEIEEPKTRRMTNQELARWLMNGIKEGKYREWRYIYGSVVFNFGSFNYQIDNGSSPVNSAILIRENGGEWHEPLVEVEK